MYYYIAILNYGELAEWSNAAVLKTVDPSPGPGVRIPYSPPDVPVAQWIERLVAVQKVVGSTPTGDAIN